MVCNVLQLLPLHQATQIICLNLNRHHKALHDKCKTTSECHPKKKINKNLDFGFFC